MINFSENVLTNQCNFQEQNPYDNSSFRKDFHILLERILHYEKPIEHMQKRRKVVFIADISSVRPSFKIIDQLTNKEEEIQPPKIDFIFDYEFVEDIKPKNKYKIKVKIETIKKYIPDESDFEDLF